MLKTGNVPNLYLLYKRLHGGICNIKSQMYSSILIWCIQVRFLFVALIVSVVESEVFHVL